MKSTLVGALALAFSLTGILAAAAGPQVKLDGCVGFYKACLVVWSRGQPYNVTWSFPRPLPGSSVHVEGNLAGPAVLCPGAMNLFPSMSLPKPGYCRQGRH
jgi:hypothetical protein